jgi:hypothetical protein
MLCQGNERVTRREPAVSESFFLKQQMQFFLWDHPSEEGWKVYECPVDTARRLCIQYLLDCLRDCYPDALKRREALYSDIASSK